MVGEASLFSMLLLKKRKRKEKEKNKKELKKILITWI